MGKKNPATKEDIALIMNLQRDMKKPVNIIQRLIDKEKNGGVKDEVLKATSWNEEKFKSVLSYSKELQMTYATKPLTIIESEEDDDE